MNIRVTQSVVNTILRVMCMVEDQIVNKGTTVFVACSTLAAALVLFEDYQTLILQVTFSLSSFAIFSEHSVPGKFLCAVFYYYVRRKRLAPAEVDDSPAHQRSVFSAEQ